jgi:carbon-monoxide dehydrogenase medium subunit
MDSQSRKQEQDPMWKSYLIPANLQDALELLNSAPNNSRIVAGSTDLILEIKRGIHPGISTLIDISRVPGLDTITEDQDGSIHIGAMVTHNSVASSAIMREKAACLAEACWQVGSPQIRNRGTIVGNVVTASPANDTIPALMALGATIRVASKQGERILKVEDLFTGVRKTVLKSNEIVKEIIIPAYGGDHRSTFYKFALRNAQAISLVNTAISIEIQPNNTISNVVIAVGAVAPTVIRLRQLESRIVGTKLDHIAEIDFSRVNDEIRPISDIRSSDLFRRDMTSTIIKRSFEALADANHRPQLPEHPVTLATGNVTVDPVDSTYLVDDSHAIHTRINGREYIFTNAHRKSLLDLIREDARLIGSKEGCAEGECGACTVHMDGKAVMACLVPAPRAHMAEITTIESISENGQLHPVQQAFIEEGAVQCGYCTPGFLMSAVKLLEERENPDKNAIKESITGNLCRCTGYYKIIRAIEKAASGEVHS